jgi:hypothetical protein
MGLNICVMNFLLFNGLSVSQSFSEPPQDELILNNFSLLSLLLSYHRVLAASRLQLLFTCTEPVEVSPA